MTHQWEMLKLMRDADYKLGEKIGCLRAMNASRGDLVECMLDVLPDAAVGVDFVATPCVFLELFEVKDDPGGMMVRVACEHGVIELDALLVNRVLSKA